MRGTGSDWWVWDHAAGPGPCSGAGPHAGPARERVTHRDCARATDAGHGGQGPAAPVGAAPRAIGSRGRRANAPHPAAPSGGRGQPQPRSLRAARCCWLAVPGERGLDPRLLPAVPPLVVLGEVGVWVLVGAPWFCPVLVPDVLLHPLVQRRLLELTLPLGRVVGAGGACHKLPVPPRLGAHGGGPRPAPRAGASSLRVPRGTTEDLGLGGSSLGTISGMSHEAGGGWGVTEGLQLGAGGAGGVIRRSPRQRDLARPRRVPTRRGHRMWLRCPTTTRHRVRPEMVY